MSSPDDRDTALAAALDDAVSGWDPTSDPQKAVAGGRRMRARRGIATGLVVVVFIGTAGWGLSMVGTDADRQLGSLQRDGWTMALPEGWHSQPITACEGIDGPIGDGVIVTNTTFTFTDPDGGDPSCEDRFVFAGFPADGVALSVEPVGVRIGLRHSTLNTPFPLSPRLLEPTDQVVGGPSMSYTEIVVGDQPAAIVRRWAGPDAPAELVAELDDALASIEVVGATRWVQRTTHDDGPGSVTYLIPDDWIDETGETWPIEVSTQGWGTCEFEPHARVTIGEVLPRFGADPTVEDSRPEVLGWANAGRISEGPGCGDVATRKGIWRYRQSGRDVVAVASFVLPAQEPLLARTAWTIIESVSFAQGQVADDRSFAHGDGTTTLSDRRESFQVTYPDRWAAAEEPINDWVSSPREILALATYPLRRGGGALTDTQLPANAVEDLGPDDALIWVNDAGDGDAGALDRPATFGPLAPCADGAGWCPDPEGRGMATWLGDERAWSLWVRYPEADRTLFIVVVMGEERFADHAAAQEVWDVLDSLRIEPF